MSDDDFEIVRGSGNIFADFGDPDAGTKLMKANSRPKSSVCWMIAR